MVKNNDDRILSELIEISLLIEIKEKNNTIEKKKIIGLGPYKQVIGVRCWYNGVGKMVKGCGTKNMFFLLFFGEGNKYLAKHPIYTIYSVQPNSRGN